MQACEINTHHVLCAPYATGHLQCRLMQHEGLDRASLGVRLGRYSCSNAQISLVSLPFVGSLEHFEWKCDEGSNILSQESKQRLSNMAV